MSKFRRFLAAKQLTEDHPNDIMMTMDSNPEVMRICYRNGFAKNKAYMTYQEASAVTDTSKFNSAFNNSDIVYFNEAKYFTGITGTVSFIAPKLLEFAFPPNCSTNIGRKFVNCYKYDMNVYNNTSLHNGPEYQMNPKISEFIIDENNKNYGIIKGHLNKGEWWYRKSDGSKIWLIPNKDKTIIFPYKQPNGYASVSHTHALFQGDVMVSNNFYSGNASFADGGYNIYKIISFGPASYYNDNSYPSHIGKNVSSNITKEFIVSNNDQTQYESLAVYNKYLLNPNYCNFKLRRVNFGITIYNEKALFPLKGLYADEYFMTKEECAEVTTLGDRFNNSDVEKFTELQYFTSLENIDNAFYGCSKLKTFTLPSHITTIGNNAFANCASLTNIEIPEGVTTIGNDAFVNCTSLESIVIPSTVTHIGDNAFSGCVNISRITMKPTTAPTLGESVWGDNEGNYVGSNVSNDKYAYIKDEYIGYDTDKWNVLFDECGFTRSHVMKLSYLESYLDSSNSNGQYINTERLAKSTDVIKIRMSFGSGNNAKAAFGWRRAGNNTTGEHCYINSHASHFVVGYGDNTAVAKQHTFIPNEVFDIEFNPNTNKVLVNGVEDVKNKNVALPYLNGNSVYPVYLFTANNMGTAFSGCNCRVYDYAVYDEYGNEVQHLIPALDLDNRPCMYDTVSGKFHYNQRTNRTDDFRYA